MAEEKGLGQIGYEEHAAGRLDHAPAPWDTLAQASRTSWARAAAAIAVEYENRRPGDRASAVLPGVRVGMWVHAPGENQASARAIGITTWPIEPAERQHVWHEGRQYIVTRVRIDLAGGERPVSVYMMGPM